MDRIKFSRMLAKAKHGANITTTDLVFKMRVLPNIIYRLENASFSFSMGKCLEYLKAVGYAIQFTKNGRSKIVSDMEGLIDWAIGARGQMPRPAFAEKLGYNRSYIRLVEAGTNTMSVDYMLKTAEVFGYKIALVKFDYE